MNMQKVQMHAAFRILDHNGRSDSERSRNRKNENIDPTRSHLNYNLAAKDQPLPPYEYFQKRKSEIYVHGNASVGIVSWVITKPKTLPENETEDFFKAAYDFFIKKHGVKNVVSSYVHRDETSPHMHFCFVPVVNDEKKGEKLCAKSITTKRYLDKAHPEAEEYISNALGHHVDIINDATKEGNKSLEEFKKGKAKEDLEKAKEVLNEANEYKNELESTREEYEAKVSTIEKIQIEADYFESSGISIHRPTPDDPECYYKVPEQAFRHFYQSGITINAFTSEHQNMMKAVEKYSELEKANKELKRQNASLAVDNKILKNALEKANKYINRIKMVMGQLSQIYENFNEKFKHAVSLAKENDKEGNIDEKEFTNIELTNDYEH